MFRARGRPESVFLLATLESKPLYSALCVGSVGGAYARPLKGKKINSVRKHLGRMVDYLSVGTFIEENMEHTAVELLPLQMVDPEDFPEEEGVSDELLRVLSATSLGDLFFVWPGETQSVTAFTPIEDDEAVVFQLERNGERLYQFEMPKAWLRTQYPSVCSAEEREFGLEEYPSAVWNEELGTYLIPERELTRLLVAYLLCDAGQVHVEALPEWYTSEIDVDAVERLRDSYRLCGVTCQYAQGIRVVGEHRVSMEDRRAIREEGAQLSN